jgi:hypothetical protein
MMNRIVASVRALPLALVLAAAPVGAQVQQASVVDDLLKRAQDAYNDLNFLRADTLANQVLSSTGRITAAQRTRAMVLIASAAYPDDPPAQRRAVALTMLRSLVRMNLDVEVPTELRWAGLDSLVEEARRTSFGMAISADSLQTLVGPQGMGKISVRSNRSGRYFLRISQGGATVAVDTATVGVNGELRFAGMRNDQPIFSTGEYAITIIGIDASGRDTVTVARTMRVESPALQFLAVPTKLDSTKLLPVRSKKFGAKAVVPAIIAGGGAFALAAVLRGDGNIATEVPGDSKGIAVGGAIAVGTILAGFADRGRPLPQNVAANKAYGEAFAKSIADATAENRRRITEHRTTVRIEQETR